MEFKPIHQRVWLRGLLWLAAGWLALCALGWLLLPSLIQGQLQQRGSAALGRTLSIGAVDFRPWSLELTLSDVALASADGQFSQLRVRRIYLDAELQSLWRMAPVVDALVVEQPQLVLSHLGDGHYDVDDILQRLQPNPSEPPSAPLRFALHNVELHDGSVDFTDHVGGGVREHRLRKLRLALPFLSNFDSQREVKVAPQLAFELGDSRFDSSAQATPFAADAKGEASLQLSHLDIAPYLPYLPASLPVRPKGAVVDSTLKLVFAQQPTRRLLLSGQLQLSDLVLEDKAHAPLLKVAALKAVVGELLPLERTLVLDTLEVHAPQLHISRNRAQQWNLASLMADAAVPAKDAPAAAGSGADAGAGQGGKAAGPDAAAWQFSLGSLLLDGGQVQLRDDGIAPAAEWTLDALTLQLHALRLPQASAPARFEASARLQATGAARREPARIALQGQGTPAQGQARLELSALDLGLAAPYVGQYLLPQAKGVVQGELLARWQDQALTLQAPRLALQDFALVPPAGNSPLRAGDLPSLQALELSDLQVDWSGHVASLGRLSLRKPFVRLARGEDGQWMFAPWLRPSPPASAPAGTATVTTVDAVPARSGAGSKATPPWSLRLSQLVLDDGHVAWEDRMPAQPVQLDLSGLQVRAREFTPEGRKPMPLSLSATVRGARSEPGRLRLDGSVMWAPLLAQGTLDIQQFPAQALAPYGLGQLRLDLLRADTSFKGQFRYAALGAGPELDLQGDAAVEELVLNSATREQGGALQSEPLLNWKALSLPGIALKLAPGAPLRLKLGEVSLADFFARLIIDPQGRLVLQDLARPGTADAPGADAASAPQAAAPAPVAAASAAAAPTVAPQDPVVEVAGIRLVNGRVAFSDRFIQPNYSADLTELGGSLGRFVSQSPQGGVQMADLDLHGRAEGTASLQISGKLNPLVRPLALDIAATLRDLELSPLSSYAVKYAGYGIERGKLSVDLHYQVSPDGQLQASNNIVLNQLVFGDAVPSAPRSLPVKLAVALLADRNGVIDLNVPLSGSLNDPQFRVWPIVWKIIGNLVTKALTSPLSLLSGLLGGEGAADVPSTVAFETGSASINPAGLPMLDKLAQALREKPKLRLTLVGTASLAAEHDAMQRKRLGDLLLAEKRRRAASSGKDVTLVVEPTPQEVPDLLKAVYQRADLKKPRNLLGLAKDLPQAEMEALLLASLPVDEDAARALALQRSLVVREYLGARQVPSASLFLGAVQLVPAQASGWEPRVELNLEHP